MGDYKIVGLDLKGEHIPVYLINRVKIIKVQYILIKQNKNFYFAKFLTTMYATMNIDIKK